MSWFTVFRRLREFTETDIRPEQRPILQMLKDLFEAEDMHPFTGFDHQDKLQYRYFIRDLRQELAGTELENPGKVHISMTKSPEPVVYKRLISKRLDVPFVRESRGGEWSKKASYLTVIVDTETHEIHVGLVFNLRNVEAHQRYVAEHLDDIVQYATDNDMELWASFNSLNQWKAGVPSTDDPSQMRAWLKAGSENAVQIDETDYKKAILMTRCSASEPAALVQETKQALLELYERFLVSDELYPAPTLEEYE